MTAPLRIVFLGSDGIALPLLDWLQTGEGRTLGRVVAVYTQPDRPVGRGQKVQANAIKTWALAQGLPVHQPEKLTDETRTELAAYGADVGLVMAYGHILKDALIATPRLGMLNFHASLLPRYRGASPIQTAVACGEREAGVSFMRIVRQLDAGPVADIERVPVATADTAIEVEQKLSAACVPLLARTLPRLIDGTLAFAPQDEPAATFCRKLRKGGGVLDQKTLDGGQRVFRFGEVEVEGRLKSPQIVYFLRRVRAEFAAGDLGHRSFMQELGETKNEPSF